MLFRILHPRFIKQFEDDAKTQVRFHITMSWFWAFAIIITPFVFLPRNIQEVIQLLILEVSLYANWATEFGALSAAQASVKADDKVVNHEPLAVE